MPLQDSSSTNPSSPSRPISLASTDSMSSTTVRHSHSGKSVANRARRGVEHVGDRHSWGRQRRCRSPIRRFLCELEARLNISRLVKDARFCAFVHYSRSALPIHEFRWSAGTDFVAGLAFLTHTLLASSSVDQRLNLYSLAESELKLVDSVLTSVADCSAMDVVREEESEGWRVAVVGIGLEMFAAARSP